MLVPLIVLATTFRLVRSEDSSEIDWDSAELSDEGQAAAKELYKRLYNFGLGKRAYSYVSEYKRLPVYNFGLGKRSPRHYNFGLGKRDDEYDEMLDDSYPSQEYVKRIRPYNFGLGKRSPRHYDFGLGKRAPRQYNFGLGKRTNKMYAFGLGKRNPQHDDNSIYSDLFNTEETLQEHPALYAMRPERSLHYNFGLGKRDETPAKSNAGLSITKEQNK